MVDSGSSLASLCTQEEICIITLGLPPAPAKSRQLLPGEQQLLPQESCLRLMPRGRPTWLPVGRVKRRKQNSPQTSAGPGPRKHCLHFILSTTCSMQSCDRPVNRTELRARNCGQKTRS